MRVVEEEKETDEDEQLSIKEKYPKGRMLKDIDLKNVYKSEIEDDEKAMIEMTKKACKFNKKENENLPKFYSPMIEQFNLLRSKQKKIGIAPMEQENY